MENFKYLSEEELLSLSSKERRNYLKAKKDYENSKLVADTLNFSEIKDEVEPTYSVDNAQTNIINVPSHNESSLHLNSEESKPENQSLNTKDNSWANEILMTNGKKNLKTHHKNFLMTEKRYMQFKELAKERGQSENALFNDILTQLFGEE